MRRMHKSEIRPNGDDESLLEALLGSNNIKKDELVFCEDLAETDGPWSPSQCLKFEQLCARYA